MENTDKTPMSEESFLKSKKVTLTQTTKTLIDSQTGEILTTDITEKSKESMEPDFIKVYYQTMLAVNNITSLSIDFVLALAGELNYANSDKPMVFYNNTQTRGNIAKSCKKPNGTPITDNMVMKHIKTAVDVGLLFKTENRGIYEVNPWMIAKGRWKDIRQLQGGFSYDGTTCRWTKNVSYSKQDEE